MLPLTPQTLTQRLNELSHIHNLLLCPTEALFWLIGYHEQISVNQASSLVERYRLGHYKVYVLLGDAAFSGIYTQAPDHIG